MKFLVLIFVLCNANFIPSVESTTPTPRSNVLSVVTPDVLSDVYKNRSKSVPSEDSLGESKLGERELGDVLSGFIEDFGEVESGPIHFVVTEDLHGPKHDKSKENEKLGKEQKDVKKEEKVVKKEEKKEKKEVKKEVKKEEKGVGKGCNMDEPSDEYPIDCFEQLEEEEEEKDDRVTEVKDERVTEVKDGRVTEVKDGRVREVKDEKGVKQEDREVKQDGREVKEKNLREVKETNSFHKSAVILALISTLIL